MANKLDVLTRILLGDAYEKTLIAIMERRERERPGSQLAMDSIRYDEYQKLAYQILTTLDEECE